MLNFLRFAPDEVKVVIYSKLFRVDFCVATRIATRVPIDFIIKEIVSVLEVCPVIIGNRTLSFDEIIRLRAEDRVATIEISETTLLSYNSEAITTFRKLNRLPNHVRKGMVISRPTCMHCGFLIFFCIVLLTFVSVSVLGFIKREIGPAVAALGIAIIGLLGIILMIVKGWCECEFMKEFMFERYEFDENGRLV